MPKPTICCATADPNLAKPPKGTPSVLLLVFLQSSQQALDALSTSQLTNAWIYSFKSKNKLSKTGSSSSQRLKVVSSTQSDLMGIDGAEMPRNSGERAAKDPPRYRLPLETGKIADSVLLLTDADLSKPPGLAASYTPAKDKPGHIHGRLKCLILIYSCMETARQCCRFHG